MFLGSIFLGLWVSEISSTVNGVVISTALFLVSLTLNIAKR